MEDAMHGRRHHARRAAAHGALREVAYDSSDGLRTDAESVGKGKKIWNRRQARVHHRLLVSSMGMVTVSGSNLE